MLKSLTILLWLLVNMWHINSKAILNQKVNVHWSVQLGCFREQVAFLPMQITLGPNQITNTYTFYWIVSMATSV